MQFELRRGGKSLGQSAPEDARGADDENILGHASGRHDEALPHGGSRYLATLVPAENAVPIARQ